MATETKHGVRCPVLPERRPQLRGVTPLPNDDLRTSQAKHVGLSGGGVFSSCLLSCIQLIKAVNSFL